MGGLTVSPNSYKHILSLVKCFLWFVFNVGRWTILEIIKVTHLSRAKGTASKPAATLPHSQWGGQTGQGAPGMSLDHTAVLEHPGVQMGRRAVEILEGSRQENTVLSMLALSPSLIFVISFSCFTFSSRDVVNICVVE